MIIQERYNPKVVGVNATVSLRDQDSIGGFLPNVTGTITIVDSFNTTIVSALPVTAGVFVRLPFTLGSGSTTPTFTTAGGASGTIAL